MVGEFDILDENTSTQGLPYDHMSVMHPDTYVFAKGTNKTIFPLNSVRRCSVGAYPTPLDIFHLNIMYCEGTHTTNYIHVHMFATSSERNLTQKCIGCNQNDSDKLLTSSTMYLFKSLVIHGVVEFLLCKCTK